MTFKKQIHHLANKTKNLKQKYCYFGKRMKDYAAKTKPLHVRIAAEIEKRTGENLLGTEIDYVITSSAGGMDGVVASEFD